MGSSHRRKRTRPPRPQGTGGARNGAGLTPGVPRVLVVDDSQDGADSLAMVLETMGAEPLVAYDGPSALDLIRQQPPQIVLLDLGMPLMDGYEVAAAIRVDPRYAGMRLIALTGFGSDEEVRRSRAAGFDDYCIKPVTAERLRTLLNLPG